METLVRGPGEALPVPGHFAVVKVAGGEADERFCVLEATLAGGSGLTSRLHRHRTCVESWFVVGGALDFRSGNETLHAPAGSFVLVPPSAPHTFGNAGAEETRIVAFYAPAGMDRFIAELGRFRTSDDPRFREFADLIARYDTDPADENEPADPPVRVLAPGEGEHLSIGGATITVKAGSEDTGGLFALLDYVAEPGFAGPPPHVHHETAELFYVLEGEPAVHIDGQDLRAQPGSLVLVAPGTVHTFANPSTAPARMLFLLAPGGFEGYFRELSQTIGDGPRDPAVIEKLLASYDYENV